MVPPRDFIGRSVAWIKSPLLLGAHLADGAVLRHPVRLPSGYLDHRGCRFCAPFVPFLRGLRPVAERPQCPPSAAKVSCFSLASLPAFTWVVAASPGQPNSEGLRRSVVLRSVDCWPLAKDLTRLSGAGLLRHPPTLSAWSGRGIPLSGCAHRSSAAAFTGRASLLLTTPWEA